MLYRDAAVVLPMNYRLDRYLNAGTHWGHRRADDLLRGATGALPTLTKPYRSTAVVVALLAMAAQRQTLMSMLKKCIPSPAVANFFADVLTMS